MKSSIRTVATLLVFAGLGLAGNTFHIPLFFGVDFLSGNIFIFLTLALFGTLAGTGIAVLVGVPTYFLWGHPYAWIGFVVQAVLVGSAIRYKRARGTPRNIPSWVVLYWLLVGLPLMASVYHYGIGVDWQGALMVAFKQADNEVLNALIAALALHYFPLQRWSGLTVDGEGTSLRSLQTNLLAAFAFLPALAVITLLSRAEVTDTEKKINTRLIARSTAMGTELRGWIDEHMQTAQALAQQVEQSKSWNNDDLHRDLKFFAASSPGVAAVRIGKSVV